MREIPIDLIKLVFPTAFVPYSKIPFLLDSIPISRSLVTYNSLLFKCSISGWRIFLKSTNDLFKSLFLFSTIFGLQ